MGVQSDKEKSTGGDRQRVRCAKKAEPEEVDGARDEKYFRAMSMTVDFL